MNNSWLYNFPALVSIVTGGMAVYAARLLPEKHGLVRTYLYIAGGLNMAGGVTQLAVAPTIAAAVKKQQLANQPPVVVDVTPADKVIL